MLIFALAPFWSKEILPPDAVCVTTKLPPAPFKPSPAVTNVAWPV